MKEEGGNGLYSFQRVCDEWVNFTSFLARWVGAGLDDRLEYRSTYPCYDLSVALDKDLSHGVRRECLLLVAAHYILLSGRVLAEDCLDLKKASNKVGQDKWTRWAENLEQVSKEEPENTRLASATKVASQYMFFLQQEILG
jgi:hypothetical protein